MDETWVRDYTPFRIAGNLYYVGSYDLACYLIVTPAGHILINEGVAASPAMIQAHVEELGYRMQDIKILLTSQVHYDHVGGLAEIKRLTGAKVMIQEADAPVLADGGRTDYYFAAKGPTFTAVQPDRVLHDGDRIKLGDMVVTALHHPGHTKGSCSYVLTVRDEHSSYKVLIANMPSVIVEGRVTEVSSYPAMAADYEYTFASLRKQRFDIWLAAHASQFGLHEKYQEGDAYNPEAFRDEAGYRQEVAGLEKQYRDKK